MEEVFGWGIADSSSIEMWKAVNSDASERFKKL